MANTVFDEQRLYYQYELVWWEGRLQPIVGTWVYLGRETLSCDAAAHEVTGDVFGNWHFESDLGWHASSVTQTFWTPEALRQKMRSWPAFSEFILKQSQSPCRSCTPKGPVRMDSLVSLVQDAMEPQSGQSASGAKGEEPSEFVEKILYYSFGYSCDSPVPICLTHLCEGSAEPIHADSNDRSWRFSTVFSRSLGLERIGIPCVVCGPMRNWLTWNAWSEKMPHFVADEKHCTFGT